MNEAKPATYDELYMICDEPEKYNITPHPDGKPWAKCCKNADPKTEAGSCQCLMRKQRGHSRFEALGNNQTKTADGDYIKLITHAERGNRFFCCHRKTKDDYHRECAGWAAKFTRSGRIRS